MRVLLPILTFLVGGVLSPALAALWAYIHQAKITVVTKRPTVAQFGVLQAVQDGKVIAESSFERTCQNFSGSEDLAEVRVDPGYYQVRLIVLGKTFLVASDRFAWLHENRRDDSRMETDNFFDDGEFIPVAGMGMRYSAVTEDEYAAYLSCSRGIAPSAARNSRALPLPATYVTWEEAVGFCEWLTNLKRNGTYRLPTAAEYEKAARSVHPSARFPWGDEEFPPGTDRAPQANYREVWSRAKMRPQALPVRSYLPIGGIYDIAGNVWQWTSDWCHPVHADDCATDPSRVTADDHQMKIVMGGSAQDPIRKLASGFRGGANPKGRYYNVGFRVIHQR